MKLLIAFAALAIAAPAHAGPIMARPSSASVVSAPLPSVAIPDEALTYTAYVAGRCYEHLSADARADTYRFIDRQDADLKAVMFEAYYGGIEAGQKVKPTRAQCADALAKSKAELAGFIR